MRFRLAKLRFRRVFRRRKRQLLQASEQTDKHIDRHLVRRLNNLWAVRRFAGLWVVIVLILIGLTGWQVLSLSGYYQHLAPSRGGVYREGIVGSFTNANPIYATSTVDKSVSQLVFSGLFKYNRDNRLVGDLAQSIKPSKDGHIYTVKLRDGLTWQDGKPLTASDVVFTYHLIQNPLAGSPLEASWQGVTVRAVDHHLIQFKLPNPLASFKYSLTNGIVPKHLLAKVPPSRLRSSAFNTTQPVGSGPFKWKDLEIKGTDPEARQDLIALTAFEDYHAGPPSLGGIVIHSYTDEASALNALQNREIDGLAGVSRSPHWLSRGAGHYKYSLPLTAETMVFFKTTSGILKSKTVRRALTLATDKQAIVNDLPYSSQVERSPLLPNQLGYNAKYVQPSYNLGEAKRLLANAGWKQQKDGLVKKKGQKLSFNLNILNTPEMSKVARQLKQQWHRLGVDVNVYSEAQDDFQKTLSSHSYDAVLHSVSLGIDPDVYVYWDSSQADIRSASRLNLSEYKNSGVDAALEAGRTRLDPKLRTVKYQKFLKTWEADSPAIVLYQPHFLYLTSRPIYNMSAKYEINSAVGRYNNVLNWKILRHKVTD